GGFLGAASGHDPFGKTGVCPQCGSEASLLVYEHFPPDQISEADVEAIRRHWQEEGQSWWEGGARGEAICDNCGSGGPRGRGYLSGTKLVCEECVRNGLLAEGLARLREDPHYYGAALLRKARRLRT